METLSRPVARRGESTPAAGGPGSGRDGLQPGAPRRAVLPAVRDARSRSAVAAQTVGAHSSGSAGPRAMPRAVGAGQGAGAARGAGSHHPCRPRVRGLSPGRFARWSLSRNLWSPPLRARRGPWRTARLRDAGSGVQPPGRARGADRGRAGGRVPARSPARPDGQMEAWQAPPAGGTRGRWAWRTGSWGPSPGASLVRGLASGSRPRACAWGRLAAKGAPGGVQPHPPSGCGSPGRHCTSPVSTLRASQSQHPTALGPRK